VIWPFLLEFIVYLLGAALVWQLGASLVGDSAAGRKAVPLVVLFWPIAVLLLVAIAVVYAVDGAYQIAADEVFGRDPEG